MKVWVRFYPEAECVSLEMEGVDTFSDLMARVYEATNLESGDKFKVSYKGIPIGNFEAQLQDYDVVENGTVSIIVVQMKNAEKENNQLRMRVKLNKPRNPGALAGLSDVALVTLFTYLEAKELVATNRVCRRWRNFTGHNEQLWKFNTTALFEHDASFVKVEDKKEEGEEGEEKEEGADKKKSSEHLKKVVWSDTPEQRVAEFPFFTYYLDRTFARKAWKEVEKLSYRQEIPQLKEMSKSKVYKLQKKPLQPTEEEEKFLVENDVVEIRKKLRTKKGMKELYKKYRTIEKKKQDWEHGNWKSIPQEWLQFDFNRLMSTSFGVDVFVHKDTEWFLTYSNGKFMWGKVADGQIVFVGHVQATNNVFVFHQVEVLDDATLFESQGETKDVAKFFDLFKLINPDQHFELKKMLYFALGKVEDVKLCKAKILPIWEQGYSDKTIPNIVKEAMISDHDGFKIFGANAKVYDSAEATLLNLENIHLTYTAILRTADKDAETSSIIVQCLEESILRMEGENAFKNALANESLSEEFLRALRDIHEDHKNVPYIMSPRGKQAKGKQLLLTRATLYFEDFDAMTRSIEYVKEVLAGRRLEKVRSFQKVEPIVEKPTFVLEEVPEWKRNLEKKKLEKKEEPKKEETVPSIPTWQTKLGAKKKEDEPIADAISPRNKPRPNETPAWMNKLATKEKKDIVPTEEKKEEAPKFGLGMLKKSTPTEVVTEKKEEKKEEVKFGLGMLKKTEPTVLEKKEEVKEEVKFGLGMLKKTGTTDPVVEKKPVETKQVDFRGALKKSDEKKEETSTEPVVEEVKPVEPVVEEVKPVDPVVEPTPVVEEVNKEEPVPEPTPVVEEVKPVDPIPEPTPVVEEVNKEEPVPEPVSEPTPVVEEVIPVEPVVPVVQEVKPEPVVEEPQQQEIKKQDPVPEPIVEEKESLQPEPVQQDNVVVVALEGKELERETMNQQAVEKKEEAMAQEGQ